MTSFLWIILYISACLLAGRTKTMESCGGLLTTSHGIIQTPNFPNKFTVPITCIWIIDASESGATITTSSLSSSASSSFSSSISSASQTSSASVSASLFTSVTTMNATTTTSTISPTTTATTIATTTTTTTRATTSGNTNVSIIVYLTQQYALTGLTFTEYMYYSDDYKVPSHSVFALNENDAISLASLKFASPFLEIKFTMTDIYGTHLRALDRLLDVYGFNITYDTVNTAAQLSSASFKCNAAKCRFLGHCFVSGDFSSYYCECFKGFTGTDCGMGPLCRGDGALKCHNGGTCTHIGDSTVTCLCPSGFRGHQCTIADTDEFSGCGIRPTTGAEYGDDCSRLCAFNGKDEHACKCTSSSSSLTNRGRARFEATVRLGNATLGGGRGSGNGGGGGGNSGSSAGGGGTGRRNNEHLQTLLEKHITRFLKNSNVSKINDLKVFDKLFASTDVTFHFFGAKTDGTKVRDAVNRLVERGRLGNFTLVSTYLLFRQEPGLMLQSVVLNQKSPIRENTELILSCVAQGSSKIKFRWYRDGVLIDVTKATRNMWTRMLPVDMKDHYTALLGISKTTRYDEGIYTCQVVDWGLQQCRSTKVAVMTPPEVRVEPPTVTLLRGGSLRVRCLSLDSNYRHGPLGYSWTKNGALFQSDPAADLWEELYPDGSLLNINNIQKSGEYSCTVSNPVATVSSSVYVTVVDQGAVELCREERSYRTQWKSSAPGPPVRILCPRGSSGQAKRICEQQGFRRPNWLTPDFSDCVPDEVRNFQNDLNGLTVGYQRTNATALLKACLEYALKHQTTFLPGGAASLINTVHEINAYMEAIGARNERECVADTILNILDCVLKSEVSLNNQQQIKYLQELMFTAIVNREAFLAGPAAASTQPHLFDSIRVHTSEIKSIPFSLQIYGEHLFADQFYMEMTSIGGTGGSSGSAIWNANGSGVVSVVSYKNLRSFLPRIYIARNSSAGTDIDYKPASRVITSWLFSGNRTGAESALQLPIDNAHVEILFQHEYTEFSEWTPLCGYDSSASFEATWRTDLCITEHILANVTRCICPLSGTFVVLLTRKTVNRTTLLTESKPIFVILSCGCCFLQSCAAFAVLLPVLYNRKCCVTLLKMQFCTATSTTMAIFILGLLKLLPQDWHGLISSTLAALLLLGSSTLIAITLVLHSEFGPGKGQITNFASGVRGAIGLSWLLPTLCAMCAPLVHNIIDQLPTNWWLEVGTFGFSLFVGTEILFVILFLLQFVTFMRKLLYLVKKHDKQNSTIRKRLGLLNRTGIVLATKLTADAFYLISLNIRSSIANYAFGVSSIMLGLAILVCFVIKAEVKLKSEPINKSNSKIDDTFCSGSINSPLSFYTNQPIDEDNEGAPPLPPLSLTQQQHQHQHQQQHQQQHQHQHQHQQQQCSTKIPLALLTPRFPVVERQTDTLQMVNATGDLHNLNETSSGTAKTVHTTAMLCNYNAVAHCYELVNGGTAIPMGGYLGGPSSLTCYPPDTTSVQGLDILQGVASDTIIGIRSKLIDADNNVGSILPIPHHRQVDSFANVGIRDGSCSSSTPSSTSFSNLSTSYGNGTGTDTGANVGTGTGAVVGVVVQPPVITITTTDDEDAIEGMMDRISLDLDYLLNRTADGSVPSPSVTPAALPPPPPPPLSSSSSSSSSSSNLRRSSASTNAPAGTLHVVHEVIHEEDDCDE